MAKKRWKVVERYHDGSLDNANKPKGLLHVDGWRLEQSGGNRWQGVFGEWRLLCPQGVKRVIRLSEPGYGVTKPPTTWANMQIKHFMKIEEGWTAKPRAGTLFVRFAETLTPDELRALVGDKPYQIVACWQAHEGNQGTAYEGWLLLLCDDAWLLMKGKELKARRVQYHTFARVHVDLPREWVDSVILPSAVDKVA